MLKTLTFVRRKAGLDRDEFFRRWCEHTRRWDLVDHPYIRLNRLMLLDGGDYDGVCENHWPDAAALEEAKRFYETDAGAAHMADLGSFMDIASSPTVTVIDEADIR